MACSSEGSARGAQSARGASSRRQKPVSQLEFFDDLEIWVTRKNIKSMRLKVCPPDGRVELSCPRLVSGAQLEEFVRKNHGWILRKQDEIAHSVMAQASEASSSEVEEWRKVVKAFVPPLIAKWEPILGVRAGKLAYWNMTSRWGSCQPSTGRICINVRLALYPPECLEYVVVHELCHLRVHGHGPEFWRLVESCLPDYKRAKALLK